MVFLGGKIVLKALKISCCVNMLASDAKLSTNIVAMCHYCRWLNVQESRNLFTRQAALEHIADLKFPRCESKQLSRNPTPKWACQFLEIALQ